MGIKEEYIVHCMLAMRFDKKSKIYRHFPTTLSRRCSKTTTVYNDAMLLRMTTWHTEPNTQTVFLLLLSRHLSDARRK